ncbi:MAG: hypothetical protein V3U03_01820 [Myxococcota bacterium]
MLGAASANPICGDGNLDVGEECDDGNTLVGDCCSPICEYETAGSACDDGDLCTESDTCDGIGICGGSAIPDCETVVDVVPPGGGTVTTDTEMDGATLFDPIETTVTSPNAGSVTITETSADAPFFPQFLFLNQVVNITAPAATAADPLVIEFRIDSSLLDLFPEQSSGTIQIFKSLFPIGPCTGAGADPDPCVASRFGIGDDEVITVRTSSASDWRFAVPAVSVPTLSPFQWLILAGSLTLAVLLTQSFARRLSRSPSPR